MKLAAATPRKTSFRRRTKDVNAAALASQTGKASPNTCARNTSRPAARQPPASNGRTLREIDQRCSRAIESNASPIAYVAPGTDTTFQ